MASKGNVLILKGCLDANQVLDLLDQLVLKVATEANLATTPKPWQLFPFICASETSWYAPHSTPLPPLTSSSLLAILLGYLKKSTAECRRILEDLMKACDLSGRPPSPWMIQYSCSVVKKIVERTCNDQRPDCSFTQDHLFGSGEQCDV